MVSLFPPLRDPNYGWWNFLVLVYCLMANIVGVYFMVQGVRSAESSYYIRYAYSLVGILLAAHGKVLSSYMVHEAAHANIYRNHVLGNRVVGIISLWIAGCPYCDFTHVKWMHMSHHNDRADTVEFDYRTFVNSSSHPLIKSIIVALEYCFVPAVEIIMHVRTAIYPIVNNPYTNPQTFFKSLDPNRPTMIPNRNRFYSSLIGTCTMIVLYNYLYHNGIVLQYMISGAIVLQFLALNDAFHHTYESITMAEYTPGPGTRSMQYEEDNTYSNLVSLQYPILNTILSLNFGYHNAHHFKAMTPWYNLPTVHETLYGGGTSSGRSKDSNDEKTKSKSKTTMTPPVVVSGNNTSSSSSNKEGTVSYVNGQQILPYRNVMKSWYLHRIRRVVQDDYGTVGNDPNDPTRGDTFIGSLGVSFLTV